jgi:hypothetical protein
MVGLSVPDASVWKLRYHPEVDEAVHASGEQALARVVECRASR